METKCYEYNFYYDDILINNIVLVQLKKITYQYVSLDRYKNQSKNDSYHLKVGIGKININETM